VLLHRILSVSHFVLLCVALGLNAFGTSVVLGNNPEEIAGFVGQWVAEVIAWTTPAYLLAANAGNAGFTGSLKGLIVLFFAIVEVAIFLTFWIGYSDVFYNPTVSTTWVASQIAAIVFITLDFVVVLALVVVTFCTQTATSLDTTRKVSGIAVIALVVEIICLGVILGVFYIWIGILDVVITTTTVSTVATTTTTVVNATITTALATTSPIPPGGTVELVLRQVGQFVAFALWTTPGCLLVIRSREGGMLSQDMFWNVVTIVTQMFNLIMAVFVSLGSKAPLFAPAAVAVSFGCFYALDLMLLFGLTFKLRAKEESWDRSNDYLYRN